MTSNCCNAPLKVITHDEGTSFNLCEACQRACDPAPDIKKTGKLVGVCNCECHCGLEECFTNHDDMCECCIAKSGSDIDIATKILTDIKAIIEGMKQIPDVIPSPIFGRSKYGYKSYICPLCKYTSLKGGYLIHLRKTHNISKKTSSKYYNKALADLLQAINEYGVKGTL